MAGLEEEYGKTAYVANSEPAKWHQVEGGALFRRRLSQGPGNGTGSSGSD